MKEAWFPLILFGFPNGTDKFRIKADDAEEQLCYFSIGTNENLCNAFIRKRVSVDKDSIQFQVEQVVGKSKMSDTYDATLEMRELLDNNAGTNYTKKQYWRQR